MSSKHLGSYNVSGSRTHVRFQFSTHAATGGNVAPASAFEAADILIYRANDSASFSATQRSSTAGITMTSPFDSLVGVHDVDIDLTDDTDAGFYAAGYLYSVVLSPDTETVDGQTITGVVLAMFEIGVPAVNVTQVAGSTASAAPEPYKTGSVNDASATTTSFVGDAGLSATDDFYNGSVLSFTSGTLKGLARKITDYVGATKTITLGTALPAAPADTDTFIIVGRIE